jgi:1,4-alpha-glucan branching enzyme
MSSATPLSDWEGERNAAGIDLTFASYNDNCGDGIYFYTGPARNPTNYGPRPDFGRADVCKYWTASMLQFVRDYYIDGFRLDSVATARFDQNNQPIPEVETWLHHLNTVVQSHVLGAICDAEDLQDCMDIVAANGFDFNSQWNDDCYRVIQASMVAPSDSGRNIDAVKAAIQLEFNGAAALPAFSATAYADNHDQARSNGRLSAQISTDATDYYARKRALLGGAIVLTGLGRPLILQGQEFNATAPFLFPTPTPLDWRQANIASGLPEAACCAGIRLAYTDIINLRTSSKSVAKGLAGIYINMFHVDYANQVIAYHRWDTGGAGDDTVVIHNLSNQRLYNYWLGLPRGGTWRLRVNTDAPCYSPDFGTDVVAKDVTAVSASQDGLNFSGAVNLGPYSTLIFSQDETP